MNNMKVMLIVMFMMIVSVYSVDVSTLNKELGTLEISGLEKASLVSCPIGTVSTQVNIVPGWNSVSFQNQGLDFVHYSPVYGYGQNGFYPTKSQINSAGLVYSTSSSMYTYCSDCTDYSFTLSKGWNLVSGPSKEISVNELVNYGISNVYTVSGKSFVPVKVMVPGKSYFINSDSVKPVQVNVMMDCAEEEATCIYDCTVIDEPGDYELCNDIFATGLEEYFGGCINITSDDVNLYGNGYSLVGDFVGRGINLGNASNVLLEGHNVSNFREGVSLRNSSQNTLTNNTLTHNLWAGITMTSGSYNILVNNSIAYVHQGIALYSSSDNNTLTNNIITNSDYSVHFQASSNNNLTYSVITNGAGDGIHFASQSNHNTLTNNIITNHSMKGIYLFSNSSTNTFIDNIICDNGEQDIFIEDLLSASNTGDNTCDSLVDVGTDNTVTCSRSCEEGEDPEEVCDLTFHDGGSSVFRVNRYGDGVYYDDDSLSTGLFLSTSSPDNILIYDIICGHSTEIHSLIDDPVLIEFMPDDYHLISDIIGEGLTGCELPGEFTISYAFDSDYDIGLRETRLTYVDYACTAEFECPTCEHISSSMYHLGDEFCLGGGYKMQLYDIGIAEMHDGEAMHAALFELYDTSFDPHFDVTDDHIHMGKIFPGECEVFDYSHDSSVEVCVEETTYGRELFERTTMINTTCGEREIDSSGECDVENETVTIRVHANEISMVMHLGDSITLDDYGYELVNVGVLEHGVHAALFDVIDSEGTAIAGEELRIFPDGDEEYIYPGTSDSHMIYVYETTYGDELFQRLATVNFEFSEEEAVEITFSPGTLEGYTPHDVYVDDVYLNVEDVLVTLSSPIFEGDECEGECIAMDESVILEIGAGSTVDFNLKISDYIDREFTNRIDTDEVDNYYYGPDTRDEYNVFTNGIWSSLGIDEQALHMIDGDDALRFADYSFMVDDEMINTEQRIWINGKARWDDSRDYITADVDLLVYSVKFTGNDYGLSQCSGDTEGYYSCSDDHNPDRVDNQGIQIPFLGAMWTIIELDSLPVTTSSETSNEDHIVSGGSITLAKVLDSRVYSFGDEIDFYSLYSVRVTDEGNVEILNSDGVVDDSIIDPRIGDNVEFEVHGYTYTFRVKSIGTDWLTIQHWREDIELISGNYLEAPNDDWEVLLKWKNRDFDASTTEGRLADSLREIVLFRTNAGEDLTCDELIPVLEDDLHFFDLTYDGLIYEEDDYDNLEFELIDYLPIISSDDWCGTEASDRTSVVNEYATEELVFLKISSEGDYLSFESAYDGFSDNPISAQKYLMLGISHFVSDFPSRFSEVYINLNGGTRGDQFHTGEDISGRPAEVYVESESGCWYVFTPQLNANMSGRISPELYFGYEPAGDVGTDYHMPDARINANIRVAWESLRYNPLMGYPGVFMINEDGFTTVQYAEQAGMIESEDAIDSMEWIIHYGDLGILPSEVDFSDIEFRSRMYGHDDEIVYQSVFIDSNENWVRDASSSSSSGERMADLGVGYMTEDERFITDRGTYISDIGSNQIEFDVPYDIVDVQFSLISDEISEMDLVTWHGREGDSYTVGGLNVEIINISQDVIPADRCCGDCGDGYMNYYEGDIINLNDELNFIVNSITYDDTHDEIYVTFNLNDDDSLTAFSHTVDLIGDGYYHSEHAIEHILLNGSILELEYSLCHNNDSYGDDGICFNLINLSYSESDCIDDCTILSAPGEYELCGDIIVDYAIDNCINIQSDDVTLDCKGYGLFGDHSSEIGMYFDRVSNSIIMNCQVEDFGTGYFSLISSNSQFINNTAISNSIDGFNINGGSDNTLIDNIASDNSVYGIAISSTAHSNSLTDNLVCNNSNDFGFTPGNDDRFIDNTCDSSYPIGIDDFGNLICEHLCSEVTEFNCTLIPESYSIGRGDSTDIDVLCYIDRDSGREYIDCPEMFWMPFDHTGDYYLDPMLSDTGSTFYSAISSTIGEGEVTVWDSESTFCRTSIEIEDLDRECSPYTLKIYPGYNFVSLPINPTVSNPALLFPESGILNVWYWNSTTGIFQPATTIEAGRGYVIQSSDNYNYLIEGVSIDTFESPLGFTELSEPGNHLIGPGCANRLHISDLLSDSVEGHFECYDIHTDSYYNSTTIDQGYSCFVNIRGD